ncbi:MAG: flagellar motor switch phosphatase FliY [Clostridiaceae bacterium]|nr:flagellar motor switch phosphatase FliY [Clostridiaceae bacterium]
MGDMLSQAEIDALLKGIDTTGDDKDEAFKADEETSAADTNVIVENLSEKEKDALGEIGNISMGTSATTLYALLGQKVRITTPKVQETTWEELSKLFVKPYVAVKVQYTQGLEGVNLLIIKEEDVKVITDLMMGGDGDVQGELNELHMSAISEAMNQMVGSAATSLSSMFEKRVDISPPESSLIDAGADDERIRIDQNPDVVAVRFSLQVGDLIDSEIMQLLPVSFAKELVANLYEHSQMPEPELDPGQAMIPEIPDQNLNQVPSTNQQPQQPYQEFQQPHPQPSSGQFNTPQYAPQQMPMQQYSAGQGGSPYMENHQHPLHRPQNMQQPVNVQPVQFQTFDDSMNEFNQNNINLLMDVPLQIAVELGRTTKKIREILEFGQGSIIELEKLAGEPVDILVNGKPIAKGEVVVIDESFGVRITDIIHPSKRI